MGCFHHQNFSDTFLHEYCVFGVSFCIQMLLMIISSYIEVKEMMMAMIMTQQR
jgi:hypothetical protein